MALIDLPPPPRSLRRRPEFGFGHAFGRWFLRLFLLPHTLAGVWMVLMAILTPIVEFFGTDVSGEITELRRMTGRNNKPTYYVHYAYESSGDARTGSNSAPPEVFDQLQVGQEYKVRVLPALPRSFDQPRGPGSDGSKAFGWLLAALFWNGILSIFLWRAWIQPWRIRNLVRDGLSVEGTIVNKYMRGGGKGSPTYVIQFQYLAPAVDDADGMRLQSYEGETATAKTLFDRAQISAGVTVLHHPRNPRRSIAYEFAEYEAGSA